MLGVGIIDLSSIYFNEKLLESKVKSVYLIDFNPAKSYT